MGRLVYSWRQVSSPKVRETRAPKVSELRSVADQLDPKYQFILQAPDVDPEGNPTLVKFSRKNQAQYIGSETPEGKTNQVVIGVQ